MKRDLENGGEGWGCVGGGIETVGGDGSETGLVMKKKGKQNRRPVTLAVSPQNTGM